MNNVVDRQKPLCMTDGITSECPYHLRNLLKIRDDYLLLIMERRVFGLKTPHCYLSEKICATILKMLDKDGVKIEQPPQFADWESLQ